MTSWGSYPSSYNIGHRAVRDLFTVPVDIEEKVDGSQFSFASLATPGPDGMLYWELNIRSKGATIYPDAPPALFKGAVATVVDLFNRGLLVPGWTYRAEALQKPTHNALRYDRIPTGHIIGFDVNTGDQEYLAYDAKKLAFEHLGLETVPLLYSGMINDAAELRRFLDTQSILGGQLIEGMVIKPVGRVLYGIDHKALMGKFVSERFREVHKQAWGESNPSKGDVIETLVKEYSSPARYQKAEIHLREAGVITEDTVKNIGALIIEAQKDIGQECKEEIKERLWTAFGKDIIRRATAGLPQWYKDLLVERQFERDVVVDTVAEMTDHGFWEPNPRLRCAAYQEVVGVSTIRTEADCNPHDSFRAADAPYVFNQGNDPGDEA